MDKAVFVVVVATLDVPEVLLLLILCDMIVFVFFDNELDGTDDDDEGIANACVFFVPSNTMKIKIENKRTTLEMLLELLRCNLRD